jgi:hypothetical protein
MACVLSVLGAGDEEVQEKERSGREHDSNAGWLGSGKL